MTEHTTPATQHASDELAEVGETAPSGELPAPAPELFERAREAVAALCWSGSSGERPGGSGQHPEPIRAGLRSALLLEQPDIALWHCEQVEAISADLGGASELSALQRASVREVARLEVILAALGNELLDGGVLTGIGAMRAATTAYLQVLDRFVRVAGRVGLERKARKIPSLEFGLTFTPAERRRRARFPLRAGRPLG